MRFVKITKILVILGVLGFVLNCTKSGEITKDTLIYSDKVLTEKSLDGIAKYKIGELKKGTVVEFIDYRVHTWNQRDFSKIKFDKGEGYVLGNTFVVGQNPENSVYKWANRKDYVRFNDAGNKERYPKGIEFPDQAKLTKEKIPTDQIIKDLPAE